ncbi:MAG: spore coat protein CotJB [Clostridiales bacterium]|nr:spore coat associated protein CotJA [Intestinimonas butyriciproducens]MBS6521888.1 spore coat protein CotJB [Clostridiales bacterium]
MPECAPLAVPYVPFQQNNPKRYSQMDALNNGTLYPGLNLPFRAKVNAASLQQTPMTELQALEFVLQELALYLDTHPSDGEAFELFRQYAALEETARADYVEIGGPIMRGETARSKTYTWLQDPWPWNYTEKEGK